MTKKSLQAGLTWRQCDLGCEVILDDLSVVRVSDVLQVLPNHVVLSQPNVGSDGLAGKEDDGVSVHGNQETIHGLRGTGKLNHH